MYIEIMNVIQKKKKHIKKKNISTQLECINTARQHTSIDNYVHTGTHTHTHIQTVGGKDSIAQLKCSENRNYI